MSFEAATDAGSVVIASSRDGAAIDGDVARKVIARIRLMTTADAGSMHTASGRDIATIDGEAAIGVRRMKAPVVAATDARTILAARGLDGAAVDVDSSGIHVLNTADAGIVVTTSRPLPSVWP